MAKKKQFSFDPVTSDKPETTDTLTADNTTDTGGKTTFWLSHTNLIDLEKSPLTDYESERLLVCEQVINEGRQVFIDVATALLEINQNKLYRATHKNFEEYCQQKFQYSRSRAYQLMDMAEVAQTLGPGSNTASVDPGTDASEGTTPMTSILPETASHFTALKEVSPEKRKEVWETVVSESKESGKSITAKQIEKANERLTGKASKSKSNPKSRLENPTHNNFSEHQVELTPQAVTSINAVNPSLTALEETMGDQSDEIEHAIPQAGPDSQVALPLSAESVQAHLLNKTSDVPQKSQLVAQVRQVINRSKDHQIVLKISGAFIINNGLTRIWSLLREIPEEEIDNSFSELITYEQACEIGLI